ncbi:MAG: FmdB family zinc ribbon protein [Bacillota bacterium]
MPTYEYDCPKCGIFEQFHSITTTLTKCPRCGAGVRRLISQNNNVIFKGSGFYTTDYKSSDYKREAAGDHSSGSSSSTSSASGAKSENKASVSPKNESKAS